MPRAILEQPILSPCGSEFGDIIEVQEKQNKSNQKTIAQKKTFSSR